MALLEIENLSVEFPSHQGVMHAVEGVSLTVDSGEVLGIVGESGSGKSVTMMALMGLVAYPGRIKADRLRFVRRQLVRTRVNSFDRSSRWAHTRFRFAPRGVSAA